MNAARSSDALRTIPAPPATQMFAQLSAALTGFDKTQLWGTGMVIAYYDELSLIIGQREIGKLLGVSDSIFQRGGSSEDIAAALARRILADDRYGPVARNIIRMWYLGQWNQLPQEWRNTYGATSFDTDHIVSSEAYRQSLVWIAGRAHPMGAKQQGFGAWAKKGPGERS